MNVGGWGHGGQGGGEREPPASPSCTLVCRSCDRCGEGRQRARGGGGGVGWGERAGRGGRQRQRGGVVREEMGWSEREGGSVGREGRASVDGGVEAQSRVGKGESWNGGQRAGWDRSRGGAGMGRGLMAGWSPGSGVGYRGTGGYLVQYLRLARVDVPQNADDRRPQHGGPVVRGRGGRPGAGWGTECGVG